MHSASASWVHEICDQFGEMIAPGDQNSELVVASPADVQQVSNILSFAKSRRLAVVPIGGGTKQKWGRGTVPQIHLSLARLNRIIEHPWQDLTCTVEAGCVWSKLQEALAIHGQFVALDPLFPERATVGGILAANDSGALRQRYGSLRDLVIGMTVVLADGTIAKTGGKVVKNVAGYDLSKLLTGSLGTLAIITEANFRLHPLPQHTRRFVVSAPRASGLAAIVAAIRASHLLVQELQIESAPGKSQLNIALNAHSEARQGALLHKMVQDEGLILEENATSLRCAREAIFRPESTVLKISTLPAQVCDFVDHLQQSDSQLDIHSVSQAGGLHWVTMNGPSERVTAAIRELRSRNIYKESTISVLQASDGVDGSAFDIPQGTLHLMKSIKQQFDPDNILSPGNIFSSSV